MEEEVSSARNEAFLQKIRALERRHFLFSTTYLLIISLVAAGLAWLVFDKPTLPPVASQLLSRFPRAILFSLVALVLLINLLAAYQWRTLRRARRDVVHELARHGTTEQLMLIDPLTGAFSRRYLDDLLPRETSRADRRETSLTFLSADIDAFDELVTQLGPQTGERVLREVAQLLKVAFRPTDTVIRYDNHEFLVVMPETGRHGALMAVRRLLEKVDGWNRAKPISGYTLSLSFGVASYHKGLDIQDVLATAAARVSRYREQQLPTE